MKDKERKLQEIEVSSEGRVQGRGRGGRAGSYKFSAVKYSEFTMRV